MKKLNCILLIDDNPNDNFFHTHTINEIGAAHQVKTASTGEEALNYLEDGMKNRDDCPFPDLIFLDINMPGMNGFEFLENARKRGLINPGRPVVIVMLTSSLNPGDAQTAKEKFSAELKAFKNKPLTEEMLKEIIENFF